MAACELAKTLDQQAADSRLINADSYPTRTQFQMFTPNLTPDTNLWEESNDFLYLISLAHEHPFGRYRLLCPQDGVPLKVADHPTKSEGPCGFNCSNCGTTYVLRELVAYSLFFLQDSVYPEVPYVWMCPGGCCKYGTELVNLYKAQDCSMRLFCKVCLRQWCVENCGTVENMLTVHNYIWDTVKGLHFKACSALCEQFIFKCGTCHDPLTAEIDTIPPQRKGFRSWENTVCSFKCRTCTDSIWYNQRDFCNFSKMISMASQFYIFACPWCQVELRKDDEQQRYFCDTDGCDEGPRKFSMATIICFLPCFTANEVQPEKFNDLKRMLGLSETLMTKTNFFPINTNIDHLIAEPLGRMNDEEAAKVSIENYSMSNYEQQWVERIVPFAHIVDEIGCLVPMLPKLPQAREVGYKLCQMTTK